MRWSLPIGRIFGIPVKIHFTFFILLAIVYLEYATESGRAGLFAVLLACALFACVLAHEIGHSLVAAAFGTKTRGIVLLPIGGVAFLEQIPRDPSKEILIALAGPGVSIVIGTVFSSLGVLLGSSPFAVFTPGDLTAASAGDMFALLGGINFVLVLFNLIPAFPMDGGRVFRGVLGLAFGWESGTVWASRVGMVIGVLFVLTGFAISWWILLLVGLFVLFGASEEAKNARIRTSLEGATVERAMIRSFTSLSPYEPLKETLLKTIESRQNDFPVVLNGELIAMAYHEDIMKGIRLYGLSAPVETISKTEFSSLEAETPLEDLYSKLMRLGGTTVPVVREGAVLGLISWDQITRFARIRRELDGLLPEQSRSEEPLESPE